MSGRDAKLGPCLGIETFSQKGFPVFEEIVAQQHDNGVHINCNGTCPHNGTVEKFHSHDYDGIVICCDDE